MSQLDQDYSRLRNLVLGFIPSGSDVPRFCIFMFMMMAGIVSWAIAEATPGDTGTPNGWAYVAWGWWWLLKWPLLVVALIVAVRAVRRVSESRGRRDHQIAPPSFPDDLDRQPASLKAVNETKEGDSTPRKPTLAELRDKVGPGETYSDDLEDLLENSLEIIRQEKRASTSLLQCRLNLSYEQALRVIEVLVQRSILGTGKGAQPREILVDLNRV
jgi:Ftsk gamma domain